MRAIRSWLITSRLHLRFSFKIDVANRRLRCFRKDYTKSSVTSTWTYRVNNTYRTCCTWHQLLACRADFYFREWSRTYCEVIIFFPAIFLASSTTISFELARLRLYVKTVIFWYIFDTSDYQIYLWYIYVLKVQTEATSYIPSALTGLCIYHCCLY